MEIVHLFKKRNCKLATHLSTEQTHYCLTWGDLTGVGAFSMTQP